MDNSDLPDPPLAAGPRESEYPRLHQHAVDWLHGIFDSNLNTPTAELATQCLALVSTLPPDVSMDCFNRNVSMSTSLALEFLGSHWMRDEHVNAGFDYIAQHLGPGSRTAFMLCWHLDVLHAFRFGDGRDADRAYNPKRPRFGDEDICAGRVDRVFVPAFIRGNHWTLFIVDIREHTITFTDPMLNASSPPPEKLSDLRWWLSGLVPGHIWRLNPNPFGSHLQTDTSSCGIFILSSAAHILLGHPLWTQSTWHDHRMEWFRRLVRFWLDDTLISQQDDEPDDEPNTSPPAALDHVKLVDGFDFDMDELDAPEECAEPCAPWIVACRIHREPSAASEPLAISPSRQAAEPMDLDGHDFMVPAALLDYSDDDYDADATPPRETAPPGATLACATKKRPASVPNDQSQSKRRRVSSQSLSQSKVTSGQRSPQKKRKVQTPEQRMARFRNTVLEIDPEASFPSSNTRSVRCGRCGRMVLMHNEYEVTRFRQHRQSKDCKSPTGISILEAFKRVPRSKLINPKPVPKRLEVPCPGLTVTSDPRIADYLRHTAMPGGGAPSRTLLANELFQRPFADLSDRQKKRVRTTEGHRYRWFNRHGLQTVFSSKCQKSVVVFGSADPHPCVACHSVLQLKQFRNALARPIPPDEHLKFVPECWREPEIGRLYIRYHGLGDLVDKNITQPARMLRDFAQGVLAGRWTEDQVFLGAIEAMVLKKSREARGKSQIQRLFKNDPAIPRPGTFITLPTGPPMPLRSLRLQLSTAIKPGLQPKQRRRR